jgi:hypothetical protein
MAKKSDILKCTKTIAQFLGNSERPSKLGLRVDNLSTLNRTAKAVEFSRKDLRSFAKVILTERQNYGEGLYILKDVNVKKLKDSQLGELFAATNPNGVSKYYTTIRRMTYSNILAVALEEQVEDKPKVAKAKKPRVKKSKTSSTKKPKVSKHAKELFNEEGNLKTFTPSKGKSLPKAKKPKASKAKVHVSNETVLVDTVVNGVKYATKMLKHDFEKNLGHWSFQANIRNIPTLGRSKKELAVLCGVYDSMTA